MAFSKKNKKKKGEPEVSMPAGTPPVEDLTRHIEMDSTQILNPIRDIYKGIIITKDWRYVKILEFKSLNFMYMSDAGRNMITDVFESMFHSLQVNIQFKAYSRKADVDAMLQKLKVIYDEEPNEACRRMQSDYMKLLQDTAVSEGVTRRFFVVLEHQKTINNDGSLFERIVGDLNSAASCVRQYLEQAGNDYIPGCDTSTGAYSLLYEIFNRKLAETVPFREHAKVVAKRYLDYAKKEGLEEVPSIPATEFISPEWIDYTHRNHVVVDNKFYTFAYIPSNGYNQTVFSGWLSLFINYAEGVDVDVFVTQIPRSEVYEKISMQVKMKRVKAMEGHDTDQDYSAIQNTISSGRYMLDGLSNGEDFYFVSTLFTIVADTKEELEYKYHELEKHAKGHGIGIRRTTFRMEQAFQASLPIAKLSKDLFTRSRRNVLTSSLASFYPFTSFELQDEDGIMIGTNRSNNSLVTIDVFNTRAHPNANGIIVGASGFGKTFTATLLALRMRQRGVQVFIITPEKGLVDYGKACNTIGGQFVSIGPGSQNSINVMDMRIPDNEDAKLVDGFDNETSILTGKVRDLLTFFDIIIENMSQEERSLLEGVIFRVYEQFGFTNDNSSLLVEGTNEYKEMPILGDIYDELEKVPELTRIRNIMSTLITGSLSSFNRHTNVDLSNKYIVFDMDGLKGTPLNVSMFVVLDFVWSKIKEDHTKKKAIFIDEAWKLISAESGESAAEYVKGLFKLVRAFGGAAFAMTQDIEDFFNYKNGLYGKAIVSNSDTRVILHLNPQQATVVGETMNLEEGEISTIMKLQRGSGLVMTGNSKIFADLRASQYEQEVITTDPDILRKRVQTIRTNQ